MSKTVVLESENQGLDLLLQGGFTLPKSGDGLVLLIKGKPGTGKSTLSLQIAKNISAKLAEPRKEAMKPPQDWFYFTCEQKKQDIIEKGKQFGCFIDEGHILDKSDISTASISLNSPSTLTQSTLMWATNIIYKYLINGEEPEEEPADKKKNVVVIDGLNLMDNDERMSFNMDWLITVLRKYSRFSILVYEPLDGETTQIDSMVDMIFQLKGDEVVGPPPYFLNKIWITKSRFQRCILGWHQYKIIKDKGIMIFPSIHYYVHKSNFLSKELELSKLSWYDYRNNSQVINHYQPKKGRSIIAQLLHDKLYNGSFTVLLGPRKTCKTLLSLDFLRDGSRNKEKGLLVSLIDNRETIIKTAVSRYPISCKSQEEIDKYVRESCENNYLFHFRPGCISSSEFFNNMSRLMKSRQPRRVVFWDLSQIDLCYPLIANDTMFFTAMFDYLKNYNLDTEGDDEDLDEIKDIDIDSKEISRSDVSSIVIGSDNCKLAKSAFTMSDNVILLLRDEADVENNIYAYVDRVEGQPGLHYLWKIPLLKSKDSSEHEIFMTPIELKSDEKIVERFHKMIQNIEKSK